MPGDTTRVNMGRRQMPRCQACGCRLRVDKVGDEFCRLCKSFAGDKGVSVDGPLPKQERGTP